MRLPARIVTALAALVVAGLSACATDNASDAAPSQTGNPPVGGITECTESALAEPATEAARALGPDNLYTIDHAACADGWAVTSGLLASADNPEMGAPTSFVFERRGQSWNARDKAAVCGTDPNTSTPPADATIPAELFLNGCAAG